MTTWDEPENSQEKNLKVSTLLTNQDSESSKKEFQESIEDQSLEEGSLLKLINQKTIIFEKNMSSTKERSNEDTFDCEIKVDGTNGYEETSNKYLLQL